MEQARLPKGPSAKDFVTTAIRFGPVTVHEPRFLRISGENLVWRVSRSKERAGFRYREINPRGPLFEQFLKLATAQDQDILAFAEKYGVLGLCLHGLPMCHQRVNEVVRPGERVYCSYGNTESSAFDFTEPLDSWRRLSAGAAALLRLRFMETLTEPQRMQYWNDARWILTHQDVLKQQGAGQHPKKQRVPHREQDPEWITRVSNEWLRSGGVVPQLCWAKDEARYYFKMDLDLDFGSNLFAYLAVRLALSLAQMKGWVVCDSCLQPFEPAVDRVRPGKRNFCGACREKGKPEAFASRDYRHRKRLSSPRRVPPQPPR